MATTSLPDRAHVVIIGGGVIGTSVAYHLTKLGFTDVVLLEQGQLSCGTTWHAAGLVGQLRASESATRLVQYSTQLYAELEVETGLSAGYKQCGGVTVARTEDRMIQLRRTAANAAAFNMECELLTRRAGARALPGDARRRSRRCDLAARRRQGQPDRPDVRAGQGGQDARRPDRRKGQGARRSDARTDGSAECAPTRATSRPRSSSTARGSGPNTSARWQGSTSRCTRPSTSTSSASTSTVCIRTCRSCATPMATPTSRKRSAAWSSAASSPKPNPGWRPTRFPIRSNSSSWTRIGTTSRS